MLGRYLKLEMAKRKQGPLRLCVSTKDSQGADIEVKTIDMSQMIDAMMSKRPCTQELFFNLYNKAVPIDMQLQYGGDTFSRCSISGFPRSLLSDFTPREKPISRQTTGATAETPHHQRRVVDWKPPEEQDDLGPIDIRSYTNPSRTLGYHDTEHKRLVARDTVARVRARMRTPGAHAEDNGLILHPLPMETAGQERAALDLALQVGLDMESPHQAAWCHAIVALRRGNRPLADSIMEQDSVIIGLRDRRGRTCLHIAALLGDAEAIRFFHVHGARNMDDYSGWLPAEIAHREKVPRWRQLFRTMPYRQTSYQQPTRWADPNVPGTIKISGSGRIAAFTDARATGPPRRLTGTGWSVISDHPIPPRVDEYYFELDILEVCSQKK